MSCHGHELECCSKSVYPFKVNCLFQMTMTELKEFVMENVIETKRENIIVPEIKEIDVKFMSRKEMKVRLS